MKAALANAAWLAASAPAWLRYRRALDRPEETQRTILRDLLARHAGAAFGRAHGFGDIRSVDDFRARVPLADYDALEPWIARIRRGEPAVLTREAVTRLVPTSGSTGARKLIPFTAGLQREFNRAIGPWMVDLCRTHPSVAGGPAYWSISPALPPSTEDSAVPIGFEDDSAWLGGLRRRLAEATFAVPSAVRRVSDVEAHRHATLRCLLRQPELRLISVWHPTFLTLLLDTLERRWGDLRSELAQAGAPRPPRDPEPRLLWPRLRVVSCWGDAQAALPSADLQRRLPGVAIQHKGLLATEAFVSIPFRGLRPLAVASHFFEFADESGALRLAHELRYGGRYRVIVTTGGGLWRYPLGDVVEVDGFLGGTPSLRFLGRGASVSDRCGEKLAEIFVTRAIAAACAEVRSTPRFTLLAPECDAAGRWSYTLFTDAPAPETLLAPLEAELRRNPHYAHCRDLGQLGPLRCCAVRAGAHAAFASVFVAAGARLGDVKPQALSQRADWRLHLAPEPDRVAACEEARHRPMIAASILPP